MYNFKEMRSRLAAWQADLRPDGEAYIPLIMASHELWMDALSNSEIIFSEDGRRFRYESFRDIDFMGPEFNNVEWRAQLNRFFALPHLAVAYDESKDERWAKMARDYIEHWIEYRPTIKTDTLKFAWEQRGDNCLSVSARLGRWDLDGWFGSLPYFEGSAYFDDAFIDRMIESAVDQVDFMIRHQTTHGNFRISEANTMLFLAGTMPEQFGKYRDRAVQLLNEAFRLQIENDGSHTEHNSGYHGWMMRVFTEFALLGKRRPDLGLDLPSEKILKMHEYALANFTPDGRLFGLNDEERWHRNQRAVDLDARIAYVNRLRAFFGFAPLASYPTTFPDAGQYFFRSGSDAMCLDSTVYYGYHTHIVRNALLFYHKDRLQLCDPGSLNYDTVDPFTHYGRISTMHNTVTVNDWYQCGGSDACVPVCVDTEEVSFIISRYTGGYMSAGPMSPMHEKENVKSCAGQHTRAALWLKGKFVVVFDEINAGLPSYDFAAHWQFLNEDVTLTETGMHTCADGANLLITSPWANCDINAVKYCGDYEKHIGFIAANGNKLGSGAPAPMLSVEGTAQGFVRPVQLVTVLAPFAGGSVPTVSADCREENHILRIRVTVDGEEYHMAMDASLLRGGFFKGAVIGEVGGVASNAQAAVKLPDGNVIALR